MSLRAASRWALALAGSLALHLAAGVALLPLLAPRPVPQQTTGDSQVRLATMPVQRSTAQQQVPDAPEILGSETKGMRAGSTGVPQRRATKVLPDQRTVAGVAMPQDVTQALRPPRSPPVPAVRATATAVPAQARSRRPQTAQVPEAARIRAREAATASAAAMVVPSTPAPFARLPAQPRKPADVATRPLAALDPATDLAPSPAIEARMALLRPTPVRAKPLTGLTSGSDIVLMPTDVVATASLRPATAPVRPLTALDSGSEDVLIPAVAADAPRLRPATAPVRPLTALDSGSDDVLIPAVAADAPHLKPATAPVRPLTALDSGSDDVLIPAVAADAPRLIPATAPVRTLTALDAKPSPTASRSPELSAARPARAKPVTIAARAAVGEPVLATVATGDALPAMPGPPVGPAVTPRVPDVAATPPVGIQVAASATDAAQAVPLGNGGMILKPGLDWSGAAGMTLDAASLATLQAFLQPGQTAGQDVRDRMADAMAAPDCARVHTVFDADTGTLELRGHVPEADARAPLIAALQQQIGAALPLRDALQILPRPQCSLLDGIAALGLPQSEEQLTDSDLVGEAAQVREYAFDEGDRLVIDLTAPDYPAYVYVDYFDASGQVLHLMPNDRTPLRLMEAGEVFSIGRGTDLDLRIAPPFGQDIAVAFASSRPLYDGTRALVEPAAPYLAEMQTRIAEARATDPAFRGEWVYLFVATHSAAR